MIVKKKPRLLVGEEFLGEVVNEPDPGYDLETSGFSPYREKIAVVSIKAPKANVHLIIHCRGRLSKNLKSWFATRKRLTGHNIAGFDHQFLSENGVDVFTPAAYDTMLGELALLTTDRRDVSVSLQAAVYRRTGSKIKKDVDHSGWMNPRLSLSQLTYCEEDIKDLIDLREEQLNKADEDQKKAIDIEMALIPVMVKMSGNGVPVDLNKLKKFLGGQRKMLKALEQKLGAKLGSLNFASHVQLKKALVNYNEAWVLKSTNAEVLKDIAMYGGELGEVCEDIVNMRHAGQRLKMYKPEWVAKFVTEGIIHPKYWGCSTDTGRMSSSDPNFQQWPSDMRSVVGGRPGYKVVWCDLSQIEVRVAAAVANCPGLKAAFSAGLHIHTDIASKSFGIPYDQVDDAYKRLAKGLTFTILFGGSWETFQLHARQAGVDLSDRECMKIFKDFFNAYPGMAELKRKAGILCRRHQRSGEPLELRLPTGLKRHLVNWKLKPSVLMNTLIQGGAAAGLKFAMLECHRRGITEYLSAAVHDELMSAWVPNKMANEFAHELEECMNLGMDSIMVDVKSAAVAKIGDYWGK